MNHVLLLLILHTYTLKNYFFKNTCIIFQYLMYWHHNELFGNVCLVVILCKIIFLCV